MQTFTHQQLIQKIESLPRENQREVEDFVEFLYQRLGHQSLVAAAAAVSNPSFQKIWDNPEDAVYDKL